MPGCGHGNGCRETFSVFLEADDLHCALFAADGRFLKPLQNRGALRKSIAAVKPDDDGITTRDLECLWIYVRIVRGHLADHKHQREECGQKNTTSHFLFLFW
jgi:hypothetical protein